MIDIDTLQEDLSDEEAGNINGKFIQLFIIPVAEIGYVLVLGSAVAYSGYLAYMFSKNGKGKKSVEKGVRSKVDEIINHKEKIRKNPKSRDIKKWEKEINNLEKQVKKDLEKARNSFKKNFNWNF